MGMLQLLFLFIQTELNGLNSYLVFDNFWVFWMHNFREHEVISWKTFLYPIFPLFWSSHGSYQEQSETLWLRGLCEAGVIWTWTPQHFYLSLKAFVVNLNIMTDTLHQMWKINVWKGVAFTSQSRTLKSFHLTTHREDVPGKTIFKII